MPFLDIFSKSKTQVNQPKQKIIVDSHEKNSLVPSELIKLNLEVEFQHLAVADYLIRDMAIERKTISDFKSSIINKRIMQQLLELKQYLKPMLIIEGIESNNLYDGILHENALRGFILSVLNNYKVPIIFTLNEKDTAKYLAVLANKKEKSEHSIRASKINLTGQEQIQFILEGFPNIGPTSAKKLISHFKSLKNIFNASQEELEKIIAKKSEEFFKLLHLECEHQNI